MTAFISPLIPTILLNQLTTDHQHPQAQRFELSYATFSQIPTQVFLPHKAPP